MDPFQSYLLLRVETMTDAERRRIDTRAGEIAAAFALLSRDLARLVRLTRSSSRRDSRTGVEVTPGPCPKPLTPVLGPPEHSADDDLADGRLTTAGW